MEQLRRPGRLDLCTQLADEDIHGVAMDVTLVPPDCFDQRRTSDNTSSVSDQQFENNELRLGQRYRPAGALDLMAGGIKSKITDPQNSLRIDLPPPRQRPQPGHQHLERKRLRQVIIGACIQTGSDVVRRIAGGQEEYWRADPVLAQ